MVFSRAIPSSHRMRSAMVRAGALAALVSLCSHSNSLGQENLKEKTTEAPINAESPDGGFFDKFFDPEDGAFDLSEVLDDSYGFVPIILPITEPAVGGGVAIAPIFIQRREGNARPNINAVGALRTTNGTEGVFGAHSGYYLDDHLHLTAGAVLADVNLDFYGVGERVSTDGQPLRYNLSPKGGMLGSKWQFGNSPWRAGLRYVSGDVEASLVPPDDLMGDIEEFGGSRGYQISSLKLSISYDSRDNIFTPTKGVYSDLSLVVNSEALGGSSDYQVLGRVLKPVFLPDPIENTS